MWKTSVQISKSLFAPLVIVAAAAGGQDGASVHAARAVALVFAPVIFLFVAPVVLIVRKIKNRNNTEVQ